MLVLHLDKIIFWAVALTGAAVILSCCLWGLTRAVEMTLKQLKIHAAIFSYVVEREKFKAFKAAQLLDDSDGPRSEVEQVLREAFYEVTEVEGWRTEWWAEEWVPRAEAVLGVPTECNNSNCPCHES